MRIHIIPIGEVNRGILHLIGRSIEEAFHEETLNVIIQNNAIELPTEAYNSLRHQYVSEALLNKVAEYAAKTEKETGEPCIVLGVADVDIYAPGMNFIFGEAQCPGKAAVISLFRLKPEFYGEKPNKHLLIERAIKEAIHEIGHALGLKHCKNPHCVMYFSLHIGITDRKTPKFCGDCRKKLKILFP
jgi:archaemetzincin